MHSKITKFITNKNGCFYKILSFKKLKNIRKLIVHSFFQFKKILKFFVKSHNRDTEIFA